MKFLILTGAGEPTYSTNMSMIRAIKSLGHEVVVCGAPYWERAEADILLEDKPFPELYTYKELLDKAPWNPDIFLQIEPHGYVYGDKPKSLFSAWYFTDPHRGGATYYKMAQKGHFDILFNAQKYFSPIFGSLARVEWLPTAFDAFRFSTIEERDPICDVVFVGQTGIADLQYDCVDDIGRYTMRPPSKFGIDRYAFRGHPGFDYAERAEMLIRLCDDFQVRLYEPLHDERYVRALKMGRIIFNRSLLRDIGTRTFEALASKRLLITDEVPHLNELMQSGRHCFMYRTWFRPFFENFSLEYEAVRNLIHQQLENSRREQVVSEGYEHALAYHSFRSRAIQLTETLDGILN